MDSLTQIVLGIATAEVVAGKELKNRTFLYGALVGTLPDLDVIVGRWLNPIDAVDFHRGMSHSLLFFFIVSPIFGYLIHHIEKNRLRMFTAIQMVFWVLFTHALLDLFTTWSTQFLWPMEQRFAWKTIFVVDPLYTLPLLIYLLLIYKTKTETKRRKLLWQGLTISSSYLMLTVFLKLYAVSAFEKALNENNIDYSGLIVKPAPLNTILWNANIKTKDGFLLADYALTDSKTITFIHIEQKEQPPLEIIESEDYAKLKKITEGWYIFEKIEDTWIMHDLRFGFYDSITQKPVFAISYEFYNDNTVVRAKEASKDRLDGKQMLRNLAQRLKGN